MPLSKLHSSVATVRPNCSLSEAARLMSMLSVGALVVSETVDAKPVGIITDRDIVKMIGEGLDPKQATVASFPGSPLQTARPDQSTEEVLALMRHHGVRRLPIVDREEQILGIISLDDILLKLGPEMGHVAGAIKKEFEMEHPEPSARERTL